MSTATPRRPRALVIVESPAKAKTIRKILGDGFLVDTSGWAVSLTRDAMRDGYGVPPVDLGVGGSIPFIADLVREFPAAQILVTGVEDPHSRAHSPNESLHLDTFRHAVATEALLLARMNAAEL